MGELARLGLDRDTAVFFSSDNGYYYGEHGLGTKFYIADDPAFRETRDRLRARLQQLRVHYSGVDSGFPEWIATQRENAANWQGYRAGYLKLLRERERENTERTKGGAE